MAKHAMNNGSWYWPDVSEIDGAKSAIQYGMWCAIIVAGFTTVAVSLGLVGVTLFHIAPSALFDAALFAVIAYGLHRHSRTAAVAGLLLFLLEKIYTVMQTGSIFGVGALGVVFLFGFFNGVRGAFAFHKLLAASVTSTSPGVAAPLG